MFSLTTQYRHSFIFDHSNYPKDKQTTSIQLVEEALQMRAFSFSSLLSPYAPVSLLRLPLELGGERLCWPGLGEWRPENPAGVAAGLAVVPVAAQVDLQRQQAVGGGPVLAALIWETVHTWWSLF